MGAFNGASGRVATDAWRNSLSFGQLQAFFTGGTHLSDRQPIRIRAFKTYGVVAAMAVLAVLLLLPQSLVAKSRFETPVVMRTSDVLPGVPLEGPNYSIAATVQNDGFINRYKLSIKGKTYIIDGTDLMIVRLRELAALQRMEQLKGTSVYKDALKKGVLAPIEGAKSLVTAPVDTVKGVVSGVGSFFQSLGHATFGSPSEQEEGVLKTAVGFGTARRQFASRFEIDPYTSFPPVKEELADVAWSATGGNLTVSAAFQAIPAPAKAGVVGTKATHGFNRLLYDKTPAELKKINERKLGLMGVRSSVAESFLDHPKFSPTHKTEIVGALAQIGVDGREVFIQRALLADNESAAFFLMRWARMYKAYHFKVAVLSRFVRLGRMPIAQRPDGRLIVVVPADHLLWTSALATRHAQNMESLRRISGVTGGEIWLAGTLSPAARKSLEDQNWVVRDNKAPALGMR